MTDIRKRSEIVPAYQSESENYEYKMKMHNFPLKFKDDRLEEVLCIVDVSQITIDVRRYFVNIIINM